MIFDLDDTLIETSKCLTPLALARAFAMMQAAGLGLHPHTFKDLLAIDQRALSAKEALATFLSQYPDKRGLLEIGCKALVAPLPPTAKVQPVPHALELLDEWGRLHTLALVTRGVKTLQLQKMEKAGIEHQRFRTLIVSGGPSKKGDYKTILTAFDLDPSQVVVCGDRIPFDLSPARECGMTTVHFRNGRGAHHVEPKGDVDVTIDCLTEIREVLTRHEV